MIITLLSRNYDYNYNPHFYNWLLAAHLAFLNTSPRRHGSGNLRFREDGCSAASFHFKATAAHGVTPWAGRFGQPGTTDVATFRRLRGWASTQDTWFV